MSEMSDQLPQFDLYRELEVDASATTETIEAAWRSLAKRHHPDITGTAPDPERIKRLNLAHDWLVDPQLRGRYDESRSRKEGDWRRYEASRPREESPGAKDTGSASSFSARYADTEHAGHTGSAAQAARDEEAARKRREDNRRMALGIGGAAGGIVVVGVAVMVVLSSFKAPQPLPVQPTAAPPSVNVAEQQGVVTSFVALASDPEASWHVRIDGNIWLDNAIASLAMDADVARPNATGTVAGSLLQPQQWVLVNSAGYVRDATPTARWTKRSVSTIRGWDPFVGLTADKVHFIRWETKGTTRVAQLRITGQTALDPTLYLPDRQKVVSTDGSDIVLDVDEQGRPVRATAGTRLTTTDTAGTEHTVRSNFEYIFTNVGGAITIRPPK